jgi:surfactin synthase thioesterase subunit
MGKVRFAATPTRVIGCATDTLVTVEHCRRAARLLGADCRELELDGGHMWMLRDWPQLARALA